MINLLKNGMYKLIETRRNTKILYLDKAAYAWVEPISIGEILVVSHKTHKTDYVLSTGRYRIYDVIDEPNLSDQLHLELEVGPDLWQGYLLISGLPNNQKKRSRIIPTSEVISSNAHYQAKKEQYQEAGA